MVIGHCVFPHGIVKRIAQSIQSQVGYDQVPSNQGYMPWRWSSTPYKRQNHQNGQSAKQETRTLKQA